MDKIAQLLEKIDSFGGISSYKQRTEVMHAWNAAFVLYKREFPNARMRKGCDSCMRAIYKWLKENA